VNVIRVVVCALLALPAGWLAGALIDRVPDRLALFDPLPGFRVQGKYLAIHGLMVTLFVLAAIRFHDWPLGVLAGFLFLFAVLVTVSVIDIELFRLPDRIVLPSLAVSVVLVIGVSLFEDRTEQIWFALTGAAIYFGFLLVAHLIYPRGMGFGDVKLAALMGLFIGWLGSSYLTAFSLVLWAMLIGFVAGSIIGVVMLILRRRSQPIPFGPFLALGAVAAALLSEGLVVHT
jgi:leader peptidase (prepilin peptidase) / N-methyltransferase